MKIDIKNDYILLSPDEINFHNFLLNLEKKYADFKKNHLIIRIFDEIHSSKKNISVLLQYALKHQQNNLSFVVVCKDVDVDDFPEDFNIVPTLIEAEDVIEMENIQRDLGF